MGYIKITDDMLWAKQIEGDADLRERILSLPPSAAIDLEVDGIAGHWEKARTGKDGRPTEAFRDL
jgi:hypothetical protein